MSESAGGEASAGDAGQRMNLSVVIPAYNVERYIEATLRSVARQDPPVHEVIVVDDGSTDGTRAAIERAASRFTLPRYQLLTGVNAGVSVARNRGLDAVSGDFVIFLDGDDFIADDLTVTVQTDARRWRGVPDVVCWDHEEQTPDGDHLPSRETMPHVPALSTGPETLRRLLVSEAQQWAMHSAAWNTRFLRDTEVRFTPGSRAGQDTEFRWIAMAQARQVRYLSSILSVYVRRPDSTTKSPGLHVYDGFLAYERAIEVLRATLPDECDDVIHAVSNRSMDRFMGHFMIHCRTRPGGSRGILRDLQRDFPGIIEKAQHRVLEEYARGPVDMKFLLFVRSPRAAGLLFQYVNPSSAPARAARRLLRSLRPPSRS